MKSDKVENIFACLKKWKLFFQESHIIYIKSMITCVLHYASPHEVLTKSIKVMLRIYLWAKIALVRKSGMNKKRKRDFLMPMREKPTSKPNQNVKNKDRWWMRVKHQNCQHHSGTILTKENWYDVFVITIPIRHLSPFGAALLIPIPAPLQC